MNMPRIALLFLLLLTLLQTTACASKKFEWGPYRGFNGRISLEEKDIADLAATGTTLFRATAALHPLMDKEEPYAINMENVAMLDRVIDACEKHGIKVLINPHTTPGTTSAHTTRRDDPLWADYYWHGHLVRLWAFLAERYRDRGAVIAGYDLLNEPYTPGDFALASEQPGPGNWNELAARLVQTVRYYDKRTPLIIETSVGRLADGRRLNRVEGIRFLRVPEDPYIVVSPHVYAPGSFTHQGLMRFPTGVRYPGVAEGSEWNRERLAQLLQPLAEFSQHSGIPMYIGEFSSSLQGGPDADRYVADLVNLFNEYRWSWTYHSWREAPVWDAERTRFNEPRTGAMTPRMQVLRDAIALKPAALPEAAIAPASASASAPAPASATPDPAIMPAVD